MSRIRNTHRIVKVLANYLIFFSIVNFLGCEPKIESDKVETANVVDEDITSTTVILRGSAVGKSG